MFVSVTLMMTVCILDKYRSFWRVTENISGNELNPGVQESDELA